MARRVAALALGGDERLLVVGDCREGAAGKDRQPIDLVTGSLEVARAASSEATSWYRAHQLGPGHAARQVRPLGHDTGAPERHDGDDGGQATARSRRSRAITGGAYRAARPRPCGASERHLATGG
jgi:hypothetical protein